jgi:hypothetical protein
MIRHTFYHDRLTGGVIAVPHPWWRVMLMAGRRQVWAIAGQHGGEADGAAEVTQISVRYLRHSCRRIGARRAREADRTLFAHPILSDAGNLPLAGMWGRRW